MLMEVRRRKKNKPAKKDVGLVNVGLDE